MYKNKRSYIFCHNILKLELTLKEEYALGIPLRDHIKQNSLKSQYNTLFKSIFN